MHYEHTYTIGLCVKYCLKVDYLEQNKDMSYPDNLNIRKLYAVGLVTT